MNNILFYSDKCKFSMMFIKKLQDENMLQEFKLINILEIEKIPPIITNIPTIVVKNINVPLAGMNAFTWLENSKYFYQKTNNINNTVVKPLNIESNTFNIDENKCKKKTDEYANLKDEDDEKITNTKFNGATQNISITNTDNIKQTINDQKINVDLQSEKLNELMNLRKMQMAHIFRNR
jgi:hypothetical protein